MSENYIKLITSSEFLKKKHEFVKEYIREDVNPADASKFDSNANVTSKNVATLHSEIFKEEYVNLNRYIMYDDLKQMYGEDVAKKYLEQLHHNLIYKHDESSPFYPYCVSVTMYPFLLNGLSDMGAESKAPKHLESFVGNFINLSYLLSGQFAGACLYKNQSLVFRKDEKVFSPKIKSFVDKFNLTKSFSNYQGNWLYENIEDENIEVWENNKFVKVKKVYKRQYKDKIYIIKTATGKKVEVSADHIFKVMFRGREIEVKAKDLLVGDTVFNTDEKAIPINKDSDTYRMGQLIGLIAGDGSITSDNEVRLSIHHDQKFIVKFIDKYFMMFFGKKGVLHDGHGKCYDYRLCSREIVKKIRGYFQDVEKYDTYSKYIDVEKYDLDFLLGFLDGILCADGSWNKTHILSLTNLKLIENIRDILYKVNYDRNIKIFPNQIGNRKDIYTISVSNQINRYLDLTVTRRKDYKKFMSSNTKNIYYYGKHTWKSSTGRLKTIYYPMSCSKVENFREYYLDVITEIETFDNDDNYVYEIETETNWYSCGGILTHNCATPEVFFYITYFVKKDYGRDFYLYDNVKRKLRKCFEQIIYSINSPATARSYQSIFWNISLFDKVYFKEMFGNFVFPDGSRIEYEELHEVQKIFMEYFQKERERALLTFPVITMAMVSRDGENVDKEFEDWVCERALEGDDFFIYQGEANALSSCCFTGDTEVDVELCDVDDGILYNKDSEYLGMFGRFRFDELSEDREYVTYYRKKDDLGYYDKFKKVKLIKTKPLDGEIIEFKLSNNSIIKCTKDHIFPTLKRGDDKYTDKMAKDITKSDFFLIFENGKEIPMKFIEKNVKKYDDYVYCFKVIDDNNKYFTLSNGLQTHNCRLRNEIEDNVFSHSLGAGGVATGSLSVLTLNLPHFVQDCIRNNENIFEKLKDQLDIMYKFQTAFKKRIEDFLETNMLPIYNAGYINISKQFLTIGLNGVPEAYEVATGKKFGNTEDYRKWVKDMFNIITASNKEARQKYGHRFNTELIPGENVAVKFAQRDIEKGYKEYEIYSSYFYKPEDDSCNISDKFILHGELGQFMDGGVALHLNLKEPYTTKEQFLQHLRLASKIGLNYWTWNVPRSMCEKCGRIVKRTVKSCPHCNGRKMKHATRVIGFLKFVESFSEGRRKEAGKRIYH